MFNLLYLILNHFVNEKLETRRLAVAVMNLLVGPTFTSHDRVIQLHALFH